MTADARRDVARPAQPEEVREAVDALDEVAYVLHGQGCGEVCVCVDDARALLPVLAGLEQRWRADEREQALRPFEELFAGGPDTVCRTTWRREPGWSLPGNTDPLTECVEVPLDDLHEAFGRAAAGPAPQTGEGA